MSNIPVKICQKLSNSHQGSGAIVLGWQERGKSRERRPHTTTKLCNEYREAPDVEVPRGNFYIGLSRMEREMPIFFSAKKSRVRRGAPELVLTLAREVARQLALRCRVVVSQWQMKLHSPLHTSKPLVPRHTPWASCASRMTSTPEIMGGTPRCPGSFF